MKLIENPGRVLTRSSALWCVYISGALNLAPYALPYFDAYVPPWVSIAILLLAPFARVIEQRSLRANQQDRRDEAR